MKAQDQQWSAVAADYEQHFIDPYRADVDNPLLEELTKLAQAGAQDIADLGCGTGPLLPFLTQHFRTVHAVDFAEGMLARARQRCPQQANVHFLQTPLTQLQALQGKLDVAVAVNSLVLPDVRALDTSLRQIAHALRPGGSFAAILPAMDAVHYCTMLLLDRALASGKPPAAARKNAAHHGDHQYYDFAFGQFHFKGLEQHFWQPFEVRYRLRRAGFRRLRLRRVLLSWEQFACGKEFQQLPPPWDWLVLAQRSERAPAD